MSLLPQVCAAVDAYAVANNLTRSAAVGQLVTDGLRTREKMARLADAMAG